MSLKKTKRAIFPRYHQLDAVRKMVADLRENKAGLKNISFFAFTATPKNKTLQIFGRI